MAGGVGGIPVGEARDEGRKSRAPAT